MGKFGSPGHAEIAEKYGYQSKITRPITKSQQSAAEPEKNWLELALESLEKWADTSITISYDSKLTKYFPNEDSTAQSLALSATRSHKSGGTIKSDLATSMCSNFPNVRAISSMIDNFEPKESLEAKLTKVTYKQIIEAIIAHSAKSNVANSKAAKIVRKVPIINTVTQKTMNDSKDTVMELISRKSQTSIDFARLSTITKIEDHNLGFFGFIFHPMRTYRNWRTKQLVSELRTTQHVTRISRKDNDIAAWQATLFKYLLYGKEAQNQAGTNDAARKQLDYNYGLLAYYYQDLEDMKKNQETITEELKENINYTIDELMDADAQLKYIKPKV